MRGKRLQAVSREMPLGSNREGPLQIGELNEIQVRRQVNPERLRNSGGPSHRLPDDVSLRSHARLEAIADLASLAWFGRLEKVSLMTRVKPDALATGELVHRSVQERLVATRTLRVLPQLARRESLDVSAN